jgi:hypothetical protein
LSVATLRLRWWRVRLPNNSGIVFKGYNMTLDSYSAFGGTELTTSSNRDLKTIIEQQGVQRLWIMGVATVRTASLSLALPLRPLRLSRAGEVAWWCRTSV